MNKRNEIEAIDFSFRNLTSNPEDAALPKSGRQLIVPGEPFHLEPNNVINHVGLYETFCESRFWVLLFTGFSYGFVSLLENNHRK